jgi:sigma-B regulation protein RsbU (phosphoserine phosphatase)
MFGAVALATKILVVDDEPQLERLIRQRFRRRIREEKYDFVFAADGVHALEKIEEDPGIEIVLSDINMPRMDGLTLVTKLNEIDVLIKTVMVSAYSDMSNIRTAMNRGAFDFVTKPIDFVDLETTIDKTIKEIEYLKLAARAQEQLSLLQQELNVAGEIQQSILPVDFSIFPAESGLEIHAAMMPAKNVGGDFYDFFWIDETRLALVIGDVSGKGMPAALFMAISRTLLKAIALQGRSTGECLTQVNHLLSLDNPKSMFVTVFYGVLDTVSGQFEYSNGGHNAPLLLSADGEMQYISQGRNSALGVIEGLKYSCNQLQLQPGGSLVLYTDGITEATNLDFDEYSEERLESSFRRCCDGSAEEILEGIIEDVRDFADGAPQSDDITAMVIKHISTRRGAGIASSAGTDLSITIKNELAELEEVNQALAQFSELHQLPADVSMAISLALDEIITNIVEYGYQDQEEHLIDVRISLEEGQLTLVIEDDGVPFDPLDAESPDTNSSLEKRPIGGLGIHLVRNAMDEVAYNYRNEMNCLVMTKKIEES